MTAATEFPKGARFEVIADGARLRGWTAIRGGMQGWGKDLAIGDVIESLGYGGDPGSDPGYGIHFVDGDAFGVHFSPSIGGVFDFRPADGYLRRID